MNNGEVNLIKAEQQLLGFAHAKSGYDVRSLITSMNLEKKEWDKLKSEYGMGYLSESDFNEVEQYFNRPRN